MKKMFAIVLALMLCVSALSMVAFADNVDYYLFGYINGADYACNDDWENLGEYKFVDGKLTATFDSDSYIAIKTGDNTGWFMTKAYVTETTGTFINTSEGTAEKMFVPGGKELTFTLVENSDGSLTVSYTTAAEGGDQTEQQPEQKPEDKPEQKPEDKPAVPADVVYTVAGTAGVCGEEWKPEAEANKMTKGDDGIWTITFKGVPAGKHALKVTDGSWDNSWGGNGEMGNFEFELTEAADITVKFNPETQKVTVLNGSNPITGDMSLAAVSVALLAATAGLVVTVSKKKEF